MTRGAILVLFAATAASGVTAETDSMRTTVALPSAVNGWRLAEKPQRVTPESIFQYMDGAGELYLAYRMDHVDVYNYSPKTGDEDAILVELYWMQSPDDGYGLLSGDWGGEPVALSETWPAAERRALYGAGLLRIWSGDLYARVMASRETDASRATVLSLGRAIVEGRPSSPVPALVPTAPATVGERFRARMDRHVFLRSHLVLNSAYFVATANLLDLDATTEALLVPYDDLQQPQTPARVRLLLARYADDGQAQKALDHFQAVYLHQSARPAGPSRGAVKIEDGWVGFGATGRRLALAFEAPDQASAEAFVERGLELMALRQGTEPQ